MTLLVLRVIESAAITLIFVRGSIFDWVRRGPGWWRELVSCVMCAGFWVGAGGYTLDITYNTPDLASAWSGWFWWAALRMGALTSAAALLLVRVLDVLECAAGWGDEDG